MHEIFTAFFYAPLYNGLIWIINIMPWHSVAIAVVIFTCIVKVILFPLSQKSVKTQFEMKRIEPEINAIKTKYQDNKQEQAAQTMKLYKDRGINPFSGVLLMIIQFPVLIALYYVFLKGGLPNIDHTTLYSFTKIPDVINMNLFGISVGETSVIFAFLAAVSQFFQMQFTVPKIPKKDKTLGQNIPDFKDELAKSMGMQMKYVMPVIIFFIAKSFPVVVSLYLITSSLFAIGQELYVRRKNSSPVAEIIAIK